MALTTKQEFDEQLQQEAELLGTRETVDRLRGEWTAAVTTAAGASSSASADDAAFNFGWAASKSTNREIRAEGLVVLGDLVKRRRKNAKDALFALALAHYSAGDITEARVHCETCLRAAPDHRRALALHDILRSCNDAERRQENWAIGMGVAVGAAALLGGLLLGGKKR